MLRLFIEHLDAQVARAWDDLAVSAGMSPFVRPGWISAWMTAFGGSSQLRLAVLRSDDVPIAILPFVRCGGSLRGPINAETPEFDAVAKDSKAARILVDRLVGGPYRRIDLRFLPAGGTLASAVGERIIGADDGPLLWSSRHQPYVDLTGTWENYQQTRVGGRRRREIQRLWRRLSDIGTCQFQLHSGQEDLAGLLHRGFEVESRGWKGRAGTAVGSTPSSALFYRSIARWAAHEGILRLAFVTLDSRAIAFGYAIQHKSSMFFLKAGYDEAYARYSPGILLLDRLIQHSFEHPELTTLEMLGEDDDYKMVFAHGTREQVDVQLFGSRPSLLNRAADPAHRVTVGLRFRFVGPGRDVCGQTGCAGRSTHIARGSSRGAVGGRPDRRRG